MGSFTPGYRKVIGMKNFSIIDREVGSSHQKPAIIEQTTSCPGDVVQW